MSISKQVFKTKYSKSQYFNEPFYCLPNGLSLGEIFKSKVNQVQKNLKKLKFSPPIIVIKMYRVIVDISIRQVWEIKIIAKFFKKSISLGLHMLSITKK